MKNLVFSLVALVLIPAFAQVQTMVNPTQQLARTVYQKHLEGRPDPSLFASLRLLLEFQVSQEVMREADELKMSVPQYLEQQFSVARFLELATDRARNTSSRSNAVNLINLIKTDIRLGLHEAVRQKYTDFVTYNGDVQEIRKLQHDLQFKLQYFFEERENHIFAVIESLKSDSELIEQMKLAGRTIDCQRGDAVNPFARQVALSLATGGDFKVGDRMVRVPPNPNYGVLTKNIGSGRTTNVVDSVAFRNPNNTLTIYDVVDESCGSDAHIPITNFETFHPGHPNSYNMVSLTLSSRRENLRQRNLSRRGGGQP